MARTGRPSSPSPAWDHASRTIAGPDDVQRVLAEVNAVGLDRANTALARTLVQRAGEAALTQPDAARVLPAYPGIAQLLPWPGGIRRGATVAAVGSMSLLMALLAGAMKQGAWAAVVGIPSFGAIAAAEIGVPLDRLAMVPSPGPDWPTVVSALIDGIDIVAVAAAPGATDATLRSLMARARQKSAVLLPVTSWPGCDLTMTVTGRTWSGLGQGHGRLRRQELTVQAVGRGRAARPQTSTLALGDLSERPVIPPPAELPPDVHPAGRGVGPWEAVQSTPPPDDPWAALADRVPRGQPRRSVQRPGPAADR